MKDNKRALRRYQKHVIFKRRVIKWINHGTQWYYSDKQNGISVFLNKNNRKTTEQMRELALNGKVFNFLKTTSRPCSCSMCSCYKYDRKKYRRETKRILKENI